MYVTEIVTMKTIANTSMDDFIGIVDDLERNFHAKLSGYIDSELLYNEKEDEWIMIQHWMTREQLKVASQRMFQDAESALFVSTLDPKTVNMKILPQLRTWKKNKD